MEVRKYAISIQWGKGRHYFLRTDIDTFLEGFKLLKYHLKLCQQTHESVKKGAKPTAYLWDRVCTLPDTNDKKGGAKQK